MANTTATPKTKVKTRTERPRLHKVILVNDDYTPREFVVTVLKAEFRMTEDQAHKVMITAHRRGVCVVAVFTKDVAETKATRATDAGRAKGYPLLFTTEPENSSRRMERSAAWGQDSAHRKCSYPVLRHHPNRRQNTLPDIAMQRGERPIGRRCH
jgi:ATP-dependent Clp protease adaptor protein ClpS